MGCNTGVYYLMHSWETFFSFLHASSIGFFWWGGPFLDFSKASDFQHSWGQNERHSAWPRRHPGEIARKLHGERAAWRTEAGWVEFIWRGGLSREVGGKAKCSLALLSGDVTQGPTACHCGVCEERRGWGISRLPMFLEVTGVVIEHRPLMR